MKSFLENLLLEPQIGLHINYPASGIIERIGKDWDWIWIDGQHGSLDYSDILAAVRAADIVNKPSVVRVPGHEAGTIGKTLDTGCSGLMVPLVDTAEQAKAIVQEAKFPPVGSRSFGGRRAIDLYGRIYAQAASLQPVIICQIETLQAVDNAESIAAVEGVDVLFFGPDDIAIREGLAMDKTLPAGHFDAYYERVAQAAAKYGKIAGSVFATAQGIETAVKLGYRLIAGGSDVGFLATGSAERSKLLRSAVKSGVGHGSTGEVKNSIY